MIDWSRVDELRREIGDDGFAEVVELFLDEVEEVVLRLRGNRSPATLEGDLHFLKGSAWNLGFAEFGALCQEAERKASRAQAADVDTGAVADCYAGSKRVFLSGLREIAGGRSPNAA